MKHGFKKRFLSFILSISMLVPMLMQALPVYSAGSTSADTDGFTTNYGKAIGAVGTIQNSENLLLATKPAGQSGQAVINGADLSLLPDRIVIQNYYYDQTASTEDTGLWYKIDAAPGFDWPAEYADYHWTYAYSVDILMMNGMTGIFDADGNTVTSLTLPLYNKIPLQAESSLQGDVKYQWQIEYETGKWVDIYGENSANITVTIGMVATLLVNDTVNLRCVSSCASKTAISASVAITVDFNVNNDNDDPMDPPVSEDYANITVDGEITNQTTIEYDDYSYDNNPIVNGEKTLGVITSLTGDCTYSWQARANGAADGAWTELKTTETYVISRYNLNGYFAASAVGYVAYIRVIITQGDTVIESDELIVTINERDNALYYGTSVIENDLTTSSGDTVSVSVTGSVPADAALSLADASDTTIADISADEIALALDVSITQNGAEWQPANGESVIVSIPASQLGLEDGEYFTVYHIHDGTTELLGPFKVENGYATFTIDGFSVVVISTNYGAAIGGVANFYDASLILNSTADGMDGTTVFTEDLPAKVVIQNYYFDEIVGKLFYKIDAAPGYTWPDAYDGLRWCYSDELTNIDINGSMGMFDKDGNSVSRVEMPVSSKPVYTVETSLQGEVNYQWQVCYDVENYLWMDIEGQAEASITLSYALLAGVIDENGMCAFRCVVSNAAKVQEGYPLVVTVVEDSADETPVDNYADITVDGEKTNSAELADRYDYYDETIGDYVPVEGGTLDLSVDTNLSGGDITYQWQGLSGTEWVTLSTSKDYTLTFSDLMFAGAYSGSAAYIRVVVTQGETALESEQLVITIAEADVSVSAYALYTVGNTMVYASAAALTSDDSSTAPAAEENVTITVQFINGQTGKTVDRVEDIFTIQYGSDFTAYGENSEWKLPVIEGYSPYLGDDTTTPLESTWVLNRTNVTADETIVIKYWPAKVNYTVIYYWQNIDDDNYTEHERYTAQEFTGSKPEIDEKTYEGFFRLLYESVPSAADGSTVIEVYYDRLYFKMLFDLDGGYGVQPVYARYDTPVTVNNPTKAGYIFMGWNAVNGPLSDGNDETMDIGAFTDIAIPAMHTNYTALWQASETATVTVVIWGQNPDDDEYSYMTEASEGLSFESKPGTVVTYDPNGGYVCGYAEEHTHGTGCETTCGQDEHPEHDDSCYTCGQASHAHTKDCYEISGSTGNYYVRDTYLGDAQTDSDVIDYLENAVPDANGVVARPNFIGSYYYIKLAGTWYQVLNYNADNFECTLTCGKTENVHEHTDDCIGTDSTCPGIHEHTTACYEGCTKEEHTHGVGCTLNVNMTSNLWTFSHADTVTVAADGSTVLNVYYDRTEFTLTFREGNTTVATITDRWGASIFEKFNEAPFNTTYNGRAWKCTESSKYGYALQTLDIMPQFDATFELYNKSSYTLKTIYYYVQNVGTNISANTWPSNTTNFTLLKTVQTYFNYATYEEEYHEMVGYTRYSASVAGFDNDQKNFSSDNTLYLYYMRDSYNLVFNNYETDENGTPVNTRTESVQFEAPLSTYETYTLPDSAAPSYYQKDSMTFKGWYLSPQVPYNYDFDKVESFDFENSTMPASDLKLYAWWQPVTHNVRFFYGEEYIEQDQVYSVTADDGTVITYDYKVPHGSTIQNPYTPPADPEKGKYIFVGWFYRDDNGQEQMWDFANTTVTRDTDIYAKWSSNTLMPYEVKFVWIDPDTQQEIEIAAPIVGSALGGNSKTFDAKGNTDLYADYQTGYFPEVQSHTITIDLEDTSKNTFTFYYQKIEKVPYTVQYIDRATGEAVVGTDGKTYEAITYGDNNKAIVTETALMIPGYLPEEYQITLTIDPDPNAENVITFYYNKDEVNGMYVVHYWIENPDGSFFEHSSFNGKGVGGTIVNATIKDIENFTYIPGYQNTDTGETEVLSGTINVGSVLELHVFYKRNTYPYKVQYLEQGTAKKLAENKIVTGKLWEEIVTESAIEIANYTLVSDSPLSIQIQKDTENPTVNIITFYYAENQVTLHYAVVGPDGTVYPNGSADFGKVDPTGESVKISSGKASGSTATALSSVCKFVGWYSDADCKTLVSDKATYLPTKADGTLWIDGTTYYAKFDYNLTSLTIQKQGHNSIDENQTFLFRITDEDGLALTVTVHGNGSVTIDGLTVGKQYTVTEVTLWSWRYAGKGIVNAQTTVNLTDTAVSNGVAFTLNPTDNRITFANERSVPYWLDGDSWCNNIFK